MQRMKAGRARLGGVILGATLAAAAQAHQAVIETETAVICDNAAQAERFVALFDGDAARAAEAVNVEVHNEKACGYVTFEFVRGDSLGLHRSGRNAFNIERVLVIGLSTPQGMRRVRPFEQFTLIRLKEFWV